MARSFIIFVAVIHLWKPVSLHGQHSGTNEIAGQLDNDRFTLRATDRYYSNGLFIKWNRLVNTGDFFMDKGVEKTVLITSLQHKIYTPSDITFFDKERHDRPYAATLEITGGLRFFMPNNQFIQTALTLGVSGPMARGQKLQEWWHRQINVFQPRGWENQIANSPVVNLHLQYSRQWFEAKFVDFISTSAVNLGTLMTNIRQGGLIRAGKLLPLSLSTYAGGDLENGPVAKNIEIYLFAGAAVEYVPYNGLIEGNWIGGESPHTRETIHWVYHGEIGLQLSAWIINATVSYNTLSEEVQGGTSHQYVSLRLGIRF